MGFVAVAFRQIDHIVLAVLALGLLLLARLVSVRDLVFGAFVIGSAIAIDNQNALGRGLPALVVIVALGAQRLVGDQSARDGARAGLGFAAALALLVAFLAEPVAYQARALARHFANTLTPAAAPQVPPPLARIRVEDRDADVVAMLEATWGAPVDYQRLRRYVTPAQPLFQTEYETSILEGVRTLQSLGVNSESVFVADMVNPFPFILQLPPLQGDLSVYVRDRTYSPTEHVEAPALLSQADLVMVPKVAVTAGERDSLLALYGAFIRRHFGVVADTPWWTIWRARP